MTSVILNSRLPNIELSYENLLHKKVQSDLYRLIPKGTRCLVWYTYWKGDNVCYILHINNATGSVNSVEKTIACFGDNLCYGKGTILCGVLFRHNETNIVAVDNIHYYCGADLQNLRNDMKLKIIVDLLTNDVRHDVFIRTQLLVALPVTLQSYTEALDIAKTLPYSIHSISLLNYADHKPLGYYHYLCAPTNEAIFMIRPQLKCDSYDIYTSEQITPYGIASITDYKTSVMMNKIFRTIKENTNLDFLEESDSDSEFENINADKHVNMKKTELFRCVYIPKFKKWKPVAVCNPDSKLSTKQEVIALEKNRRI